MADTTADAFCDSSRDSDSPSKADPSDASIAPAPGADISETLHRIENSLDQLKKQVKELRSDRRKLKRRMEKLMERIRDSEGLMWSMRAAAGHAVPQYGNDLAPRGNCFREGTADFRPRHPLSE